MNPEQWNRLKTVFHGALEQPAEARRAWLQQACGGDKSLLREAEALLQTHDTAGNFLEAPAQVDPGDLDTLLPDTQLGQYRILEEIGRGGMGVVYLAEDVRLGRHVAIKSLPVSVGASPELRERLRREARAAATISHPAVAAVYALEELDDHLFIVSEYVRGETLRDAIARGPMDPVRARRVATEVAHGLSAAHDAGVVHRDLKPENVLVTADDRVKVVDFGIAQVEGSQATRLTRAGAAIGTPAYMAPEQLLELAVDARADIYALGVVLSEILSGRHPMAERQSQQTSPSIAELSAERQQLDAIARRCMRSDPGARYQSARDLVRALESDSPSGSFAAVGAPTPTAHPPGGRSARWWWEFHQAAATVIYSVMVWPGWRARGLIGGTTGRAFFVALLAAVIVAGALRLHLWFTSRYYPEELSWQRRRVGPWLRLADWAFAVTLASGTLLIRDERSTLALILLSVGIGAAVAFLVIEPTTARAAFKDSSAQNS